MRALDTNILIRFLVEDHELQTKKARKLITNAENTKQPLFIPILVTLEMIWVLQSVYDVKRTDILLALSSLLQMPILEFENQQMVRDFLISAKQFKGDLSDILIAQSAHFANCETTLTFDKKASKFELFTLV